MKAELQWKNTIACREKKTKWPCCFAGCEIPFDVTYHTYQLAPIGIDQETSSPEIIEATKTDVMYYLQYSEGLEYIGYIFSVPTNITAVRFRSRHVDQYTIMFMDDNINIYVSHMTE